MAKKDPFNLDPAEFVRSLADRSKVDRINAASTLGKLVASDGLPEDLRGNAHDILETLSADAELRVRAAVARAISDYPLLPPRVAEELASDVLDVGEPILKSSPVLSDDFLTELVSSGRADEGTQVSIAMREALSELVSGSLLKTGEVRAVETVLANETARISEDGYGALLARDDLDHRMLTLAAARPDLPAPIIAQCHTIILTEHFEREIGAKVRDTLIEKHALPPEMAGAIVQAAIEDALAHSTAETAASTEDLVKLATTLHKHQDLTPSLLLRMTCNGSLDFAAAAFHILTGETLEEVENAFSGAGTKQLMEQYHQSGLEPYFRFAIVTAIKRISSEQAKPYRGAPEKPVQDIIREIVGFYRGIAPASIEQVIARLCHEADRWAQDNGVASSP